MQDQDASEDTPENSNGVDSTLRAALSTSQKELEQARAEEATSSRSFTELTTDLRRQVSNKEKTISEVKTHISQAQQSTSQMQAQQLEAKALLKASQGELASAEEDYQRKTAGFKERRDKRSDEMMAVREATQLLTSEAARKLLEAKDSAGAGATTLLQVAAAHSSPPASRRKAVHVLRRAPTPGLALLALGAHTHMASTQGLVGRGGADPFSKVKSMIRDMLQKLQQEHSKEADHKAWCDSEMGKSTKMKMSKVEALQKLSDRIGVMDAEIADLEKDLEMTSRDLDEMQKAKVTATTVRTEERDRAAVATQQYRDAVELIGTAIKVLKKFYSAESQGAKSQGANLAQTPPKGDEAYKPQAGMGKGIIGIMEIAQQDFADLLKETETTDASSEQEYKELMSETEVRTAVFRKDVEYKTRAKLKLEGDRMHATTDTKSYKKELEAVEAYLGKLADSCIAKAEKYSDRKAKREEELAALREAQEYLTSAA